MNTLCNLKRAGILQLLLLCFFISSVNAKNEKGNPCNSSSKYLYWTGEQNNDFFNEENWRLSSENPVPPGQAKGKSGTTPVPVCLPGSNSFPYSICVGKHDPTKDKHPKAGTIDPGVAIDYNLLIESGNVSANGDIVFACDQKGMTLLKSQLNVTQGSMSQGVLSLQQESTVHFRTGLFSSKLILNFLDDASWVYMHAQNPDQLTQRVGNILINNLVGTLDNDFRINQYYQAGAVIRPLSNTYTVLTLHSGENQQGTAASLKENIIYSGATIPAGLDNAIQSFTLKRGYMATVANNTNGTGKSKVYIASEADLTINTLDAALRGNLSFVRVVPWNWVTKKGTGGFYDQLNAGWFYNWNLNNTSKPNYEYVPMAWGAGGASPASINEMIQKKKTTHVLGFNESDNCTGESGQYNNLCQPAVAVAYYENLMSLGVRIGTPAPRENGPTTWLLEFAQIAKAKDVRFDFVAVHWYDWGSNPASSPNASPVQIFNRFKTYLENVHRIYQLPIWVTEFNANPNRSNAIQEAFLKLALPYLDSLSYIERYAYFQPNPANAQNAVETAYYLDANGALTNIGELYRDHTSTPSITDAVLACPNNLELDQPYVAPPSNSIVFEAECGKFIGNQWSILEQANASNGLYIRGDVNRTGVTALAKQVHYEFELAAAGTYRAWVRAASSGTGSIRISIDGKASEQITPLTSSSFTWFQIPRFYDLGVGKHRLTIEFPNSNIMLDQVAMINGVENLELLKKDSGFCTPSTLTWGLEITDLVSFHEAELANKGSEWTTKTSVNAKAGAYVASQENSSSTEAPEGTDKVISFTVSVEQTDEYDIWAKIQSLDATKKSLWIAVDDEPFRKWDGLYNASYEWYWKKFHYSYGSEERSFTYFLHAGTHTVRIAIASGAVAVDRLAIATKGKLPETTDPNILLLTEKLEFEAEDATILGAASVVVCNTSSNGKLVNMFTLNTNGVRYEQIVAEAAGAYKLKVSYISAVVRSFRLIVNGVTLGRQTVAISGGWCFNGGSPGIFETTVMLKRGVNVIDITPFSGEAPFMDKIKLEKAPLNGLSLEAETAEVVGSSAIVTCATSSNGALVNMGLNVSNAIRFNNILANETKVYQVDIYYISGADRNMRVGINGQPFTTQAFLTSGAWCFAGGAPKIKTIDVQLSQGTNTIEFRPTGADAPFIDKIVIRETAPVITQSAVSKISTGFIAENKAIEQPTGNELMIYPNPAEMGTTITLTLPETLISKQGPVLIQVTDLTGRNVFTQNLSQVTNRQVKLQNRFERGMYIVSVSRGGTRFTKKLITL